MGNSGSGTFNQSGGTSNIQSDSLGNGGNLFLGNNVGSNGSYNLGGPGALSVSGTEYVGNLGPGTFSQSGGTNNAGGSYAGGIILGNNTAVSGSYSLSGSGLLAPYALVVGNLGSGTFIHSGGTNSIGSGGLTLGNYAGSSGSYTLSNSGQLSAVYEYVGSSGSGTFNQLGGTNNVGGSSLYLGFNMGSSGSYTLGGSGLLSAENYEYVGQSGTGTFIQSGGTNAASPGSYLSLYVGNGLGSSGSYALSSSGLLSTYALYLGYSGSGAFTQSGGTNNLGSGGLYLGYDSGSSGSYALNGGLLAANGEEYVGYSGGGAFTQSGGTNDLGSSYSDLYLGSAAGSGSYNLKGSGVLSAADEWVGTYGPGTFSQSGGTNMVAGTFSLGSSGTYNLSGGALLVAGIQADGGTFDFGGGTLVATAAFSTSQGMTLTGSGGNGTINTSGNPVTLSGLLAGPGGLTKAGSGTLTLCDSNTYSGNTTISGGILQLDFTQPVAPTSNIINNATNASPLVLGGGSLAIQGSPGTTNSQQFNGLTVDPGSSGIVLSASSSNALLLSVGTISRSPGGTLDFTLPAGTQSATNGITTATANTNGILGGYATVSGTSWATVSGSNVIAYSSTSANYASGNINTFGSSGTVNLSPSGAQGQITSAESLYTLDLTSSATTAVTMNATGSLTLLGGGLLGNSSTASITGGTLEGSSGVGELIVITPQNLTINSIIANNGSTGALTKAGTATLTLTGSNTYSGATTIGAGTLQIGNGGGGASIGSTNGVLDNGSLVFSHSDSVTFTPPISGIGNLTQAGAAVLILTGSNTYSGSTTISGGTLQVGNGTSGEFLGSATVTLNNNTALVFNHADALTYSGSILGGGNLTQTGAGVLTLPGDNTYSGNTTVSAGTLQIGNGTSGEFLGSGSVSLSNSAALVFNHADALAYSGIVSGTGSLTQTGPGILTLTGNNSYSGGTTISAGTLQVGNGGATGSLPVNLNITNNAALVYDLSGNPTVGGIISGSGSVTQMGTGNLVLTASNNYSGGTTISGGTLQVSGSGTLGAGPVTDNGMLVFSLSGTPTYAGLIGGVGNLTQMGAGVLTLLGDNTYSGSTTVSAGTLQVGNGTSGEFLGSATVTLNNNTALVFNHAELR